MMPAVIMPARQWKAMSPPPAASKPSMMPMIVAPAVTHPGPPASPVAQTSRRPVPPPGSARIHKRIVPAIVDIDIRTAVDICPAGSVIDDVVVGPAIAKVRPISDTWPSWAIARPITNSRPSRSVSNPRSVTWSPWPIADSRAVTGSPWPIPRTGRQCRWTTWPQGSIHP